MEDIYIIETAAEELKKCPFCGHSARLQFDPTKNSFEVVCSYCDAQMTGFYNYLNEDVKQKAINAWNKRKSNNVFYLCDNKACDGDCYDCQHTENITHAKNFELFDRGYFEKETQNTEKKAKKEIKTITTYDNNFNSTIQWFDNEVNNNIKNGYKLVRRDVFVVGNNNPYLYAELEKDV